MALAGNLAFIAAANDGLQVLDVSDPGQPQHLTSLDVIGAAFGVDVVGNLAFVALGERGLRLVDGHGAPVCGWVA